MTTTTPIRFGDDWNWTLARQRCLRYARRLLTSEDDAEEAVQEAMARAWRKRAQLREDAAALRWMLEITRNEALRLIERRREWPPIESTHEPWEESGADATIRRVQIRRSLQRLSPDDRVLLALRYEADLTQSAVAERTGLPEGTVKVRLHRLRNQLRGDLTDLI
jgi:RNA polymerase sigma-70 factor (ECF subfamily)